MIKQVHLEQRSGVLEFLPTLEAFLENEDVDFGALTVKSVENPRKIPFYFYGATRANLKEFITALRLSTDVALRDVEMDIDLLLVYAGAHEHARRQGRAMLEGADIVYKAALQSGFDIDLLNGEAA